MAIEHWTDEERACAAAAVHAAMIEEDAQILAEKLAGNKRALDAFRLARLDAEAGARAAEELRPLEALALVCDARARLLHGASFGLGLDLKSAAQLVAKNMNDVKHARNREASDRVATMWAQLKAQGVSKSKAASVIATAVNLAPSTIESKLKKL